mgnify:CR=1 FL=1
MKQGKGQGTWHLISIISGGTMPARQRSVPCLHLCQLVPRHTCCTPQVRQHNQHLLLHATTRSTHCSAPTKCRVVISCNAPTPIRPAAAAAAAVTAATSTLCCSRRASLPSIRHVHVAVGHRETLSRLCPCCLTFASAAAACCATPGFWCLRWNCNSCRHTGSYEQK